MTHTNSLHVRELIWSHWEPDALEVVMVAIAERGISCGPVSCLGLPRVASTRLQKYSSNVLVLEYSFNSASGRKFQFPVTVFQINKQLLELYANLAPSPSNCDLRVASFAT